MSSPTRQLVAYWLMNQTTELGVSSRGLQLAVSLLDLFHAKHPDSTLDQLRTVCAAALSLTVKITDGFVLPSTHFHSALGPEACNAIGALEVLLMVDIEWQLDLPLASDIAQLLQTKLKFTSRQQETKWKSFVAHCYTHATCRFGPLAIAVAGLCVATQGTENRAKFSFADFGLRTEDIEALIAEVEHFNWNEAESREAASVVARPHIP